MVGKPREPSPPDRPHGTPAQGPGKFDQADELTGPLAVERLRKSDGRALILYTLHSHPEHPS
jgi:hypothetical protein